MTDYISREVVLNLIKELYAEAESPEAAEALFEAHERISDLPSADVKPVVRGEWSRVIAPKIEKYWCSECKGVTGKRSNFCPNCGADMRGEQHE